LRTVIFDVDGVLVHGYTGQLERLRRWDTHIEADLGINPDRFRDSFIREVFEKEVLTGRKALLTALEETLPALGYRGSPFTVASYWLTRDSQVNFQLLDLVRRLRLTGKVRLCIATNQEHMRAFYLWNKLGFENLFDDLFHSARLGVLKPDLGFYARIEEILGPQDEPPLFFDDSESVVNSAREYGWDAVLYRGLMDCDTHPWIAAAFSSSK